MNNKLDNNAEPSPVDDERVSAYLDGALSDTELADFEALLRDNVDYRSAVEEMRQVSEAVRTLPRLNLDAAFSERVMAQIQQTTISDSALAGNVSTSESGPRPVARQRNWRSFTYAVVTLAAALLLMVLSGFNPFLQVGPVANVEQPNAAAGKADEAKDPEPQDEMDEGADDPVGMDFVEPAGEPSDVTDAEGLSRQALMDDLDAVQADGAASDLDGRASSFFLREKPDESLLEIPSMKAEIKKAETKKTKSDFLKRPLGVAENSDNKINQLPPAAPATRAIPRPADVAASSSLDPAKAKWSRQPPVAESEARANTNDASEFIADPFIEDGDDVADRMLFVRPQVASEGARHSDVINRHLKEFRRPDINQVAVVSLPAQADIDRFFSKAQASGIQLRRLSELDTNSNSGLNSERGGVSIGGGGMGGGVTGGVIMESQPAAAASGGGGYGGAMFGDAPVQQNGIAAGGGIIRERMQPARGALGADKSLESVADNSRSRGGVRQSSPSSLATGLPAESRATRGRAYFFDENQKEFYEYKEKDAQVERFDELIEGEATAATQGSLFGEGRPDKNVANRFGEDQLRFGAVPVNQQPGTDGGHYVLVEAPLEVMSKFVDSLNTRPSSLWYAQKQPGDSDEFGLSLSAAERQEKFAVPQASVDGLESQIESNQSDLANVTTLDGEQRSLERGFAKRSRSPSRYRVEEISGRSEAESLYWALGFRAEDKKKIDPQKPIRILFHIAAPIAADQVVTVESDDVVAEDAEETVGEETAADDVAAPAAPAIQP